MQIYIKHSIDNEKKYLFSDEKPDERIQTGFPNTTIYEIIALKVVN